MRVDQLHRACRFGVEIERHMHGGAGRDDHRSPVGTPFTTTCTVTASAVVFVTSQP